MPGFAKVKVNTVLMRDVNHHQLDTFLGWIQTRPIQLRFIELMETGEGSELFRKHHISGQVRVTNCCAAAGSHPATPAQRRPRRRCSATPIMRVKSASSCRTKKISAPPATVWRVSSVGKLHLCLFGEGGVSLRDLLEDDGATRRARKRVSRLRCSEKKQTHFLHQNNTGITQNLSYIGG